MRSINRLISDQHVKAFLQIDQGITNNLSLIGFVFVRKNLNGGNRYFIVQEFIYYEEEIFNDIYSNDYS